MNRGRVRSLLLGMVLLLSACADNNSYEPIVVIDPGHGGVDPGAIGSSGNVVEKAVALRMGLALRDQLEATGRYQVVMTREDDRTVRLPDRLEIASQSQGELFISLHADSLVSAPEVSGAWVYTLSEQAAGEPLPLAGKEAPADGLARIDLSHPGRRDANGESIRLAELLVQELNGPAELARRAQAGFVVLRSRAMPSVLIELGYLSNPADERALADDAHIARLAAAVARAVDAYFGVGPA